MTMALWLAFQANNSEHDLTLTSSTDGGSSWKTPAQSYGGIQIGGTPAMAIFGDKTYVAFQANDSSHALYVSSATNGDNWTTPAKGYGGIQIGSAPAMASFYDKLYIAFQANDSSHALYITSSADGVTWKTPAQGYGGIQIGSAPAMAVFNGKLYIAFQANDSSHALYVTSSTDGTNWTTPAKGYSGIQVGGAPAMCVAPGGAISQCLTTTGDNSFAYLGMMVTNASPPSQSQTLTVASGSPYLSACICGDTGAYSYPAGATVTITDPTGKIYNQDSNTEALFVQTDGNGSPWLLTVANPAAGTWTVTITAEVGVNFSYCMTALPSKDTVNTITQAMAKIIPMPPSSSMVSGVMAHGVMPYGITPHDLTSDSSSYWMWYGTIALMAVGAVVAGISAPVIAVGLIVAVGTVSIAQSQDLINSIGSTKLNQPLSSSQVALATDDNTALSQVVVNVRAKVGVPSTTNPAQFASRSDMGVSSSYFIHLDIGGEGYHVPFGMPSGFPGAINLNAQVNDSQPPYGPIPMLVQVPDFSTYPPYPFVDGIADLITMQGAPLNSVNVSEITRLIRPGGKVALWVSVTGTCPGPNGTEDLSTNFNQLLTNLKCTPTYAPGTDSACTDEFKGIWDNKICLVNNN
ncbi:MAG: exo-alpha-sialidase [Limnobacter sp.]|nr:exo-alpha-sialidase [Limnobacter sp.]